MGHHPCPRSLPKLGPGVAGNAGTIFHARLNRRLVVARNPVCYVCSMPTMPPKINERECPACKGSGLEPVKQPKEPGRKIYAARCERCHGKGRVAVTR